jgi:hypothetical protein
MLPVPATDPNFQTVLTSIINDAEQRIYRELDLLATVVRDSSGSLTPNSRNFTFPQFFIVSESINTFDASGNKVQLVPTTREYIDAIWGNEIAATIPSIPQYYAMITDQTIIVGPPPDSNYPMEVIGTVRPAPLSISNPTTYLTTVLPDLWMAETLIFGYSYMKDFGATVDDPRASTTWEAHYQMLKQSADTEENRKKYASMAWSSKQPTQLATPPRA